MEETLLPALSVKVPEIMVRLLAVTRTPLVSVRVVGRELLLKMSWLTPAAVVLVPVAVSVTFAVPPAARSTIAVMVAVPALESLTVSLKLSVSESVPPARTY